MEISQKFRPSLTPQQITYIISVCDAEFRPEMLGLSTVLSKQLKLFAYKMHLGTVHPAFESIGGAEQKASIEERLEMGTQILAERRELAYRKWQGNPALCTAAEISMAHTYRYESGMMSTIEEEKYESHN